MKLLNRQDIEELMILSNGKRLADDGWAEVKLVEESRSATPPLSYPTLIEHTARLIFVARCTSKEGVSQEPTSRVLARLIHQELYHELRHQLHLALHAIDYGTKNEVRDMLRSILKEIDDE